MILAGDVGGTKTLIGLFDLPRDGTPDAPTYASRPVAIDVREFPTTAHEGLPDIIDVFFAGRPERPQIDAAAFGVAGPVINQTAEMTNVPWSVNAAELCSRVPCDRVRLLNDLEAMAHGVTVLDSSEVKVLQQGQRRRDGNIAIIAAGTGLGESLLHWVDGRYDPIASEGGHTDFAARTDREIELLRFLRERYGRAETEYVLSGPGLLNLSDFTHQQGRCENLRHVAEADVPAAVSKAALEGRCPCCVEALDLFVSAYGASAGNLALTAVTTGGVFIGGGIAPKILPALEKPAFIEAFNAKAPMQELLESIPVQVILNRTTALLGAAVYAAGMTGS